MQLFTRTPAVDEWRLRQAPELQRAGDEMNQAGTALRGSKTSGGVCRRAAGSPYLERRRGRWVGSVPAHRPPR